MHDTHASWISDLHAHGCDAAATNPAIELQAQGSTSMNAFTSCGGSPGFRSAVSAPSQALAKVEPHHLTEVTPKADLHRLVGDVEQGQLVARWSCRFAAARAPLAGASGVSSSI